MSRPRSLVVAVLSFVSLAAPSARAEAGAGLAAEARARASLVWIFGDDDVFGRPGATTPPSPAGSIGDRPGYDTLFEGLSSRYTGRENRVELRWAGEASGIHPSLTTRAELALGVDASSLGGQDGTLRFEDAGTQIELFWQFSKGSSREGGAGLRLYPLHGDRERLGELEALGVGGEVGPERESPYASARGAIRAGRLWLELFGVRAFAVLKTAAFTEPLPDAPAVQETSYAVFGGVESTWRRIVSFGLGFGHFEHGRLPSVEGAAPRATTTSASARLALGRGLRAPLAPASFANEPPPFDRPLGKPEAESGWALGVEGAHILQRLVEFEHPAETALSGARALAAAGTLRAPRYELRLALIAREAGFVMRNVPGVFPGQTTPRAAAELAELGVLASGAVAVSKALRVSLDAGVRRPAAVVTRAFDRAGQAAGATALLEGPGEGVLLPAGELPVPVVDVRPRVELRASRLLELLAWVSYRRDYNRVRLVPDAAGEYVRGFADPNRFGYGVAARAVW